MINECIQEATNAVEQARYQAMADALNNGLSRSLISEAIIKGGASPIGGGGGFGPSTPGAAVAVQNVVALAQTAQMIQQGMLNGLKYFLRRKL